MLNSKLNNFDVEKIFTKKDYSEFYRAVETRSSYEFIYAKPGTYLPHPTTGVLLSITGRICDNGIWQDNYLYSISYMVGYGGTSRPYCPIKEGIFSYDEVIGFINKGLGILPKKQKQLTFFDMIEEPTMPLVAKKSNFAM